jgi:hypothetical protein
MRKSLLSLSILALLAVAAAGCGGGGSSGGGSGGGTSAKADSAKLANCLNEEDWITAPTGDEVSGSTATGGDIDILIYDTVAEAQAAFAKLPKKSTALDGTSVIKFFGTISATGPAPAAPVNQKNLAIIKTCIAKST